MKTQLAFKGAHSTQPLITFNLSYCWATLTWQETEFCPDIRALSSICELRNILGWIKPSPARLESGQEDGCEAVDDASLSAPARLLQWGAGTKRLHEMVNGWNQWEECLLWYLPPRWVMPTTFIMLCQFELMPLLVESFFFFLAF